MDEERKEQIRARVKAATPGPWKSDGKYINAPMPLYGQVSRTFDNMPRYKDDNNFIAHARDDIPDLLAALDAAEQRAAEAEAHLRTMLDVKGNSYCLWCHSWLKDGHKPDCPYTTAAKWLDEHG